MLKAGERAPEFTLPDETGDGPVADRIAEFRARSFCISIRPISRPDALVRPVSCAICMTEIQRAGLRVVGISPQSPESHAKFRDKYHLPFVLLSDQHKAVIKMYGVNGPLGIGVRRASYLIDGGRRIRDAVLADFMIGRHADFVRKAIMLRARELLNSSDAAHWRGRCAAPSRCT